VNRNGAAGQDEPAGKLEGPKVEKVAH